MGNEQAKQQQTEYMSKIYTKQDTLPSSKDPIIPSRIARCWVPDEHSENCLYCKKSFTATNRRHHCRLCGHCLCGDCCANTTVQMPLRKTFTLRVCGPCKFVQIDALNEMRKADAFQMKYTAQDFLDKFAYIPYNDQDGKVSFLSSSSPTTTTCGLFPSVVAKNAPEWIQLFKEKGGKCQEKLVYLNDLVKMNQTEEQQQNSTLNHSFLTQEDRVFEVFHQNPPTFEMFNSKSENHKVSTEETAGLFLRCLHYFALGRHSSSFMRTSSAAGNTLNGLVQFYPCKEVFKWFTITMAYILGADHEALLPDEKEIHDSKNPVPGKNFINYEKQRQRDRYCSFILRDNYIDVSDYILKALSSENEKHSEEKQEAREVFSWLLLGVYYLAAVNEAYKDSFLGDPKHESGFGFGKDHIDGSHRGNLKVNLKKIVEGNLIVVGGLNDEEKKWYQYVMEF